MTNRCVCRPSAARATAQWALRLAVACGLAVLAACGGGGSGGGGGGDSPAPPPSPPADPGVAGAPYFPLAVGDRWRTRSGGELETTRVVAQESGGFRLRTQGPSGEVDDQLLVISSGGVSSEPLPGADGLTRAIGPVPIARFPLRVGNRYTAVDKTLNGQFDVDGDGRPDNLRVVIEVSVVGFVRLTVPAGSFDNVLQQRTTFTQTFGLSGSGRTVRIVAQSDDWYAPGVGPIRTLLAVESDGTTETSEDLLLEYRVGSLRSDSSAPAVASRTPANGSLGRTANVQLVFSEDIERATSTAALAVQTAAGVAIPGTTEWTDARTLRFVPSQFDALVHGRFEVRLAGVVEDWVGNRLEGASAWAFTVDSRGPTLLAMSPTPDAIEVPMAAVLSFTFDEALDPALANPARATLSGPSSTVPVTVTVDGSVLRVTPNAPLRGGETYILSLNGIQDPLGNNSPFGPTNRFTTTRGEPGRFNFPVEWPALAGFGTSTPIVADVDGDGHADLVVVATGPFAGQVPRVVRGVAGGGFADTSEALPNPGCDPAAIEVVDIDADGRPDLLGTRSLCGTYWLQQQAGGTWIDRGRLGPFANQARSIRLAGQARPGVLTVGNFDPDLVLVRPSGGAGSVGFLPNELLLASIGHGRLLHVVDLNGDGRDDIVLADAVQAGRVWLGLQGPDARFELRSINVPGGRDVRLVSDLDGDSRPDLLLSVDTDFGATLQLLPQGTDGNFVQPGRRITLPASTTEIYRADVDGDGRQDLIVTRFESGVVTNLAAVVLRNDGSVGYEPLLQYPTLPMWSGTFVFGDFNGDGLVDLLQRNLLVTARTPWAVPATSRARPLGLSAGPRGMPARAPGVPVHGGEVSGQGRKVR